MLKRKNNLTHEEIIKRCEKLCELDSLIRKESEERGFMYWLQEGVPDEDCWVYEDAEDKTETELYLNVMYDEDFYGMCLRVFDAINEYYQSDPDLEDCVMQFDRSLD